MYHVAYDVEIHRQLGNTIFYRKLSRNTTLDFQQQIMEKLDLLLEMGETTKPEHAFMAVDFPVTPVLCTLPKIH